MSFTSKTTSTTVKRSVLKDKPTARVPIRGINPTWKLTEKYAFIPSLPIRNTEGILKCGTGLSPILKKSSNIYSYHQSSKIPCSVKIGSYSSVTTVKTTASNLNCNENKITYSNPSYQKSLQNNNLVTPRPAIRDCTMVTNASSNTNKTITNSKEIINKKSVRLTGEDFFPDSSHKSILDDMNILKTPVNDSLTRRTILSNVVPVTSLITKTHHYSEKRTISDAPTPRNALEHYERLSNTVLFNSEDKTPPSLDTDSQAISSPIEENVMETCSYKVPKKRSLNSHIDQNPLIDSRTLLTTGEESESSTGTSEDVILTNIEEAQLPIHPVEETVTMTLSRQDTEPFAIPDIDLTMEDESITDTSSYVINEESITSDNTVIETVKVPENTFSAMKRTVGKENKTSEIIVPSSDIIINLPPLISPINSDTTKPSDDIQMMIPDSTTDVIANTPRIRNYTKNKTKETSLRRKMQSRQVSVKRKIIENTTSRTHSEFDKTKKIKIDKTVTRKPRKVEISKRKTENKKSNKQKKVKIPLTIKRRRTDDNDEPSTPKTRNLMINPRTKQKRSPALLKMN